MTASNFLHYVRFNRFSYDKDNVVLLSNQNNFIGDRSHWQVEVVNIVGEKIRGFLTSI